MNRDEEARLIKMAAEVSALRRRIDAVDCCIDCCSRLQRYQEHNTDVYLSIRSWAEEESGGSGLELAPESESGSGWYAGVSLPAEVVQAELMPVLKRIRDAAWEALRNLPANINLR